MSTKSEHDKKSLEFEEKIAKLTSEIETLRENLSEQIGEYNDLVGILFLNSNNSCKLKTKNFSLSLSRYFFFFTLPSSISFSLFFF